MCRAVRTHPADASQVEEARIHAVADASNRVCANQDRLIAIVGPTAIGKTDLAMRLARCVPAEIVGADSRQVYRHMDVGTAKPSAEERAHVPHHLVDIIDPRDEFSLGEYAKLAKDSIKSVNLRAKTPLLVGGTGQYVMALLEGWSVPPVAPDANLRARLDAQLKANGIDSLIEELGELDPVALEAVDLKNPRRIIRAIERAASGHTWGSQPHRAEPSFRSIVIGLTADREQLYDRADRRMDSMIVNGFLHEVEWLLAAGYAPELPAMSGIGYSELVDHLLKGVDLQDSIQRAKYRTHRYIRQQSNWFRASDTRIKWFEISETDAALDYAQYWLQGTAKGI